MELRVQGLGIQGAFVGRSGFRTQAWLMRVEGCLSGRLGFKGLEPGFGTCSSRSFESC